MERRVRLIRTLAPKELPVGIEGSITMDTIHKTMCVIRWDNGMTIAHHYYEIEEIPCGAK